MKTAHKFLGVEKPDFTDVGESLAEEIKRRIQAAPGDRWNKTGRLLNSIHAVIKNHSVSVVVAASDRLQRDELAERFAEEILPTTLDEATRKALALAIFGAFKVDAK